MFFKDLFKISALNKQVNKNYTAVSLNLYPYYTVPYPNQTLKTISPKKLDRN